MSTVSVRHLEAWRSALAHGIKWGVEKDHWSRVRAEKSSVFYHSLHFKIDPEEPHVRRRKRWP